VVDIESIFALIGFDNARDMRQFYTAKSFYTVPFFRRYSETVLPAFLSANGLSKKVLVMDCDNTLWGGILGEDGEEGIQMSDLTAKGKIFKEVQNLILGLQRKGVLLALCSKNNSEDVEKVLESHPEILISNKVLVSKKVNWRDKATNLVEMAKDLNLGISSFVFVDDSSFEIGLIKKELPEIEAFQVPSNLSDYPSIIREIEPLFFALSHTQEDKTKTVMYLQEEQRKSLEKSFESIEDYLKSLGLSLRVIWNDSISVPRAAQMTQKTNQFNLTTKRYTESDIERMLKDPEVEIAMFSVADSYGEYGITGMAIIVRKSEIAEIDTLLMSCRVIGRNIELAFFDELVKYLTRKLAVKTLVGKYIKTAKNAQVDSFYEKLGFAAASRDEHISNFSIQVDNYKFNNLNYIKVVNQNE
jgi:FkbH-like protein